MGSSAALRFQSGKLLHSQPHSLTAVIITTPSQRHCLTITTAFPHQVPAVKPPSLLQESYELPQFQVWHVEEAHHSDTQLPKSAPFSSERPQGSGNATAIPIGVRVRTLTGRGSPRGRKLGPFPPVGDEPGQCTKYLLLGEPCQYGILFEDEPRQPWQNAPRCLLAADCNCSESPGSGRFRCWERSGQALTEAQTGAAAGSCKWTNRHLSEGSQHRQPRKAHCAASTEQGGVSKLDLL